MTSRQRDDKITYNDRLIITNGQAVLEDAVIEKATVILADGEIVYVGCEDSLPKHVDVRSERLYTDHDFDMFNAQGGFICPGMIDLHVHGGGGADVMDGTVESLTKMAKTHGVHGTTAFVATTMTENYDRIIQAAQTIRLFCDEQAASPSAKLSGPRLLGMHLEGPYIHPKRVGAQDPDFVRPIDLDELHQFKEILGDAFRAITMAPELPGGMDAIDFLKTRGVALSAGHTDATFEEAIKAFNAGVGRVTHMYNAMSPLHHRDPGVVGAAFLTSDVMCEVIADGIHLHPAAIRIVYEFKGPDRICLITDGIAATGMPPGQYALGGQKVTVEAGACRLSDGTLAGSILTMDRAVGFMVKEVGIPVWEAVRMASLNPAIELGISKQKGSLAPGKDADVTVLNGDFRAVATWVEGIKLS